MKYTRGVAPVAAVMVRPVVSNFFARSTTFEAFSAGAGLPPALEVSWSHARPSITTVPV